MKIEIVVPVWGQRWVQHWLELSLPVLRREANDVSGRIVVYTDAEGRALLRDVNVIDEIRDLPIGDHATLGREDLAHVDAINRALRFSGAVAPLVAEQILGRGTLAAAKAKLDEGYRAVMALNLPTPMPPTGLSALHLSAWMALAGGVLEWGRPSGHPGHYGWRCGDATLLRPIYIPPVLIMPNKAGKPRRAVDHFMTEDFVRLLSEVAYLEPEQGCIASPGIFRADRTPDGSPGPMGMTRPEMIAAWMLGGNVRDWNLHHMAHRFWCGTPDKDQKPIVEAESDLVVGDLARRYHAAMRSA